MEDPANLINDCHCGLRGAGDPDKLMRPSILHSSFIVDFRL
jgi:hypothetical protein